MGSSPPGSSAHGVLQARILAWVAISVSPVDVRRVLYPLEADRRSSRPREAAAFYACPRQGPRNRAPAWACVEHPGELGPAFRHSRRSQTKGLVIVTAGFLEAFRRVIRGNRSNWGRRTLALPPEAALPGRLPREVAPQPAAAPQLPPFRSGTRAARTPGGARRWLGPRRGRTPAARLLWRSELRRVAIGTPLRLSSAQREWRGPGPPWWPRGSSLGHGCSLILGWWLRTDPPQHPSAVGSPKSGREHHKKKSLAIQSRQFLSPKDLWSFPLAAQSDIGPAAAAVSEMPSSFGAHFPGRKHVCGHHLSAAELWVPAGTRALLAPQIQFRTGFRDPRFWHPRLSGRGLAARAVARGWRPPAAAPAGRRAWGGADSERGRVSRDPGEGDIRQSLPPRATVQTWGARGGGPARVGNETMEPGPSHPGACYTRDPEWGQSVRPIFQVSSCLSSGHRSDQTSHSLPRSQPSPSYGERVRRAHFSRRFVFNFSLQLSSSKSQAIFLGFVSTEELIADKEALVVADLNLNLRADAVNLISLILGSTFGSVSGNVFGDSPASKSPASTLFPSFGTVQNRTTCEVS